MTTNEFQAEVRKRQHAIDIAHVDVVRYAKTLVSVLKDARRPAAADELAALVFQSDAAEGELDKFIMSNKEAAMAILRDAAEGRR